MTKLRQPELFLQHTSPLFKNFPAEGRDDSPVSVIAHSAVISHPSSACTSMEHHTYRDAKLQQLCREHGYSTSDDDAINNNLALSQESHKVGALESLPETHSFPSRALHRKMDWLLEEPHQKVELSLPTTSDSKDLSSETDSTASEPNASDESSGENFSVFYREGGAASTNFSPYKDVTGVHEKTMVIRPNFSWGGRRLMHENGAEHDGLSAECKHSEWRQDQTSLYGQSKESLAISKPLSVSREYHKSDWHRLKSTDPSGSIKSFVKEREEDPWKQNGRQGTGSCVAKTAPSSELTPMGYSFQGVQNVAGSQINQGALDAWSVSCGTAGKTASVRALPGYICDAGGRGCVSRTLPSKWEDAEKWLVSVDSPSHSHLRNGVAPSKALQYGVPPVKRVTNMAVPAAKPANYSFSSDDIVGDNLTYSQEAGAAASDSELPKALEYRALVRSGSQKYRRQDIYGESSFRTEAGRAEMVNKLRCYGGEGGNGRKEAPSTMINDSRSTGTEPSFSDKSKEKLGSLRPCNVHGVQALGGAIGKDTLSFSNNDSVGERVLVLQPGTLTEILTQDKYADTVVQTPMQEYVVQASRRARSASMKDASTEISPVVSRRDMGTQITPQPSSRTSKCPTPIKNNSPARHNTPSRLSASWNNTGGLNLLELDSCHLAKLELRDLPGDSAFHSFDRSASIWSTREEEEEESSACLRPPEILENKLNLLDARASAWEDAERAKFTAKYKREEARIDAWENLERAKAEAQIRKLEVKLEKLRIQSTEKIINKLKVAQRRAHEMRATSEAQQVEQLARIAERATNIRKSGHFPANIGVCFARMA